MRWALMVLALASGCERESRTVDENKRPPPGPAHDARPAPAVDANVAELLDALEPKQPPPPPVVRRKPPQGDCRTEYAPRPGRDPNPMCKVDGGSFMMGGKQRVTVKGFYIDQFEVTAQQAALFLNAHGNVCGAAVPGGLRECVIVGGGAQGAVDETNGRFEAITGREQRPEMFTINGARRYCAWVGKLVPTDAQWEYAARHDPRTGRDLEYPWGDTFDGERFHRLEWGDIAFRPVGSFDSPRKNGASPWGLYDAFGNLEEIVSQCSSPGDSCPHHTRGSGWEELKAEKKTPWDVSGALRCARAQ